jgi:hypothetical protein
MKPGSYLHDWNVCAVLNKVAKDLVMAPKKLQMLSQSASHPFKKIYLQLD